MEERRNIGILRSSAGRAVYSTAEAGAGRAADGGSNRGGWFPGFLQRRGWFERSGGATILQCDRNSDGDGYGNELAGSDRLCDRAVGLVIGC